MTNNNARTNMIKQQLRTGGVLSEAILALYEKIPRADFVPTKYRDFAYSDMQIPLSHRQVMLTPLEEGSILEALNLTGQETVLEIGTGSGFFTALLSQLCQRVISIDIFEDLQKEAKLRLDRYACRNVELFTGNAYQGWLEKAPYDVIVITAAVEKITDTMRLQLLPSGKICAVIGKAPSMLCLLDSCDAQGTWTEKFLFSTCIPPLINPLKTKDFVF